MTPSDNPPSCSTVALDGATVLSVEKREESTTIMLTSGAVSIRAAVGNDMLAALLTASDKAVNA